MIREDAGDDPNVHVHTAVNAKTYCNQAKKKWLALSKKATDLDGRYDLKIQELGHLCSNLFNKMGSSDVPQGENKELIQG